MSSAMKKENRFNEERTRLEAKHCSISGILYVLILYVNQLCGWSVMRRIGASIMTRYRYDRLDETEEPFDSVHLRIHRREWRTREGS